MPSLTLLLSLWNGWRPSYRVEHARSLAAQIREYTRMPALRIVLLTDDVDILRAGKVEHIDEVRPMPAQSRYSPEVPHRPNCFRRISFFDPVYGASFGTEWIASLDLDTLIVSELDPVLQLAMTAPSGLAIIRSRWDPERGLQRYNGGFFAIKVGTNAQVWESFDWRTSPLEVSQTRWIGSDQVWIALKAQGALTLGAEHGVYFMENSIQPPPDGAPPVMITFSGILKPWSKSAKRMMPKYFEAYRKFA